MPRQRPYGPWSCPRCGETDEARRAPKNHICRSCVAARARQWRQNNLEYAKARDRENYARRMAYKRWHKYGLSDEVFHMMLTDQGGRCAICKQELNHRVSGSEYRGQAASVHVDHDHATGNVRGLLCSRCNRALGWFKDDVGLLIDAWCYLLAHSAHPNPVGVG